MSHNTPRTSAPPPQASEMILCTATKVQEEPSGRWFKLIQSSLPAPRWKARRRWTPLRLFSCWGSWWDFYKWLSLGRSCVPSSGRSSSSVQSSILLNGRHEGFQHFIDIEISLSSSWTSPSFDQKTPPPSVIIGTKKHKNRGPLNWTGQSSCRPRECKITSHGTQSTCQCLPVDEFLGDLSWVWGETPRKNLEHPNVWQKSPKKKDL